MEHLGVELLVLLGVNRELATRVAERLGAVIAVIVDPSQRAAETAVALAELQDGRLPTILGGNSEEQP